MPTLGGCNNCFKNKDLHSSIVVSKRDLIVMEAIGKTTAKNLGRSRGNKLIICEVMLTFVF